MPTNEQIKATAEQQAQDLADKYADLFGRITGQRVTIGLDALRTSGLLMVTFETKAARDKIVGLSRSFRGLALEHTPDDTTAVFAASEVTP